jgi:hypothetical protein
MGRNVEHVRRVEARAIQQVHPVLPYNVVLEW